MNGDTLYSLVLHNIVLPASLTFTRSHFYQQYKTMLRLECADRQDVERLQWAKFKQLLSHAYRNVPYYQRAFEQAGVDVDSLNSVADLPALPELTKRNIQKNFPDRITAQNVPNDDWQYVSTRGTSNRLISVQDFAKRDSVRATELRAAHLTGNYRLGKVWAEIPPDACSVVCGDENEPDDRVLSYAWEAIREHKFRDSRTIRNLRGLLERKWLYRRITYPPFGPEGTNISDESIARYVTWLQRDKPYLLKALPTYLHKIAKYALRNQIPALPVRVVKPMGGSVSPVMRDTIRRAFRGEYREDYGSSEFGGIACDCPAGNGLHVFSDAFIIEIVKDNQHCPPGTLGKVLVTDLNNYAMPMIRYEIGDLARLDTARCSCGRTGPRLKLEGRHEDSIVAHGGELVSNDAFMDFFFAIPSVDQFQLVQSSAQEFRLFIVPESGCTPDVDLIVDKLKSLLLPRAKFEIRIVPTIAPETSGKFRFVKRAADSATPQGF